MGTLKNMFTAVENTGRSCQEAIGKILLALYSTTDPVMKSSPLEFLIGNAAWLHGLLLPDNMEAELDISNVREQAVYNIEANANYNKNRFELKLRLLNLISMIL